MKNVSQENIKIFFKDITDCFINNKEELCGLDRIIGDGDHGESMARGCQKGYEAIKDMPQTSTITEVFNTYSDALIANIGGAIGPIFGTLLSELGMACEQSNILTGEEYASGLNSALEEIMDLGGAKPGDKTLVDALSPAAKVAQANSTLPLNELAQIVEDAAKEGMLSTIPMQAKMGRSHFLREKSIGYQDAGATSVYYLLKTIKEFANK